MAGIRVLIVEDETIVRMDLQRRIERLGYHVVGLASSGEEAVAKAAELQPDLVLLDISLQDAMDGLEAGRQIRAARPVPLVYLSAYAGSTVEPGLADSIHPCLSKPFHTTALEIAMRRALAGA